MNKVFFSPPKRERRDPPPHWTAAERAVLTRAFLVRPPLPIWQWADENVLFVDGYPTEFKGRHNSAHLPFWRSVLDWCHDPAVTQITILKCSQSMATGTVAENLIRYSVARSPCDILFVGGQQETTEKMMEARIKPGLQKLSTETAEKWAMARERGMDVYFPDMILSAIWASSLQGIKSFSYRVVIADEASIYDAEILSKLRKRFETAAFPKFIVMSAMDKLKDRPSSQDPTLLEYKDSDACEWMMPDPGAPSTPFKFEMGFRDKTALLDRPWGLKWSKDCKRPDGSWDKKLMMETAHYVTPGGAIITDANKLETISAGAWVPTHPDGTPGHRGARVTSFMLPWKKFSQMALDFHQSLALGKAALRVFVLESLVEEFWDDREHVEEDALAGRVAPYPRKTSFTESDSNVPGEPEPITFKKFYIGKEIIRIATTDVQKDWYMFLVREWVRGGDSGLVHWQEIRSNEWSELDALCESFRASLNYIDNSYAERKQEVYEHCTLYPGFVPCISRDSRMVQSWLRSQINPFEGTSRQSMGATVGVITFDRDVFLTHLFDLMAGRTRARWYVPTGIEMQYRKQVTAWEKIDGAWGNKKGQTADHLAACEVQQVVAATVEGFMSSSAPESARRR